MLVLSLLLLLLLLSLLLLLHNGGRKSVAPVLPLLSLIPSPAG